MKRLTLRKQVKEVIAYDCAFRVQEYEDGIVLEFRPLPQRLRRQGGVCAEKFDIFGNVVRCKGSTAPPGAACV